MSRRQMRRMMDLKKQSKEHEKEESDDDEQPEPSLHQRQTFEGLEVSSSDSEPEGLAIGGPIESTSPTPKKPVPEEDKYGAKKKIYSEAQLAKQRQKENKIIKAQAKYDENEWFYDLPRKVEEIVVDKRQERKNRLSYINPKHIDVNNELAKVFDVKDKRSSNPPHRRGSHWIGLSPDLNPVRVKGIDMICYNTLEGIKFFKFVHNAGYVKRCRAFINNIAASFYPGPRGTTLYELDCVEAFIENFDSFYINECHTEGKQQIEQCLYNMQLVAEPTFGYLDGTSRLLYEIVENRPFFIALLKYIYVLSNTALHTTALALAKVLHRLDPSDPLAVTSFIDALAIRAREFQWIIVWSDEINIQQDSFGRTFNMRYSRALSLFHIACKTKQAEDEADAALSDAIINYPWVVMTIIGLAKIPVPDNVKSHALFNPRPNYPVPGRDMQQLIKFYVWLTVSRWQEPLIAKWVVKVLKQVVAEYDNSSDLREQALKKAIMVTQVYRRIPLELQRHFHTISSMAKYIGDELIPVQEPTISFNPYPRKGSTIDVNNYYSSIYPLSRGGISMIRERRVARPDPAPFRHDNISPPRLRNEGLTDEMRRDLQHALLSEGRDFAVGPSHTTIQLNEPADVNLPRMQILRITRIKFVVFSLLIAIQRIINHETGDAAFEEPPLD